MSTTPTLKVHHQGSTRIIASGAHLPSSPLSFGELRQATKHRLGLASERDISAFEFEDHDGDHITISTHEELALAWPLIFEARAKLDVILATDSSPHARPAASSPSNPARAAANRAARTPTAVMSGTWTSSNDLEDDFVTLSDISDDEKDSAVANDAAAAASSANPSPAPVQVASVQSKPAIAAVGADQASTRSKGTTTTAPSLSSAATSTSPEDPPEVSLAGPSAASPPPPRARGNLPRRSRTVPQVSLNPAAVEGFVRDAGALLGSFLTELERRSGDASRRPPPAGSTRAANQGPFGAYAGRDLQTVLSDMTRELTSHLNRQFNLPSGTPGQPRSAADFIPPQATEAASDALAAAFEAYENARKAWEEAVSDGRREWDEARRQTEEACERARREVEQAWAEMRREVEAVRGQGGVGGQST